MFSRHQFTLACLTLPFALAACGRKETTLTYTMTVNRPTAAEVVTLINASERVLVRRLSALGEKKPIVTAVPAGASGGVLGIALQSDEIAPRVKQILSEPFTFDIRLEKPAASGATASSGGNASDWIPTGIDRRHLIGVQSVVSDKSGEAAIDLTFTDEGRRLLTALFAEHKGENIGIFVRDLMVSSLKIESENVQEHIVISGVPSSAVAQVFTDDVNVGLYVEFTPQ